MFNPFSMVPFAWQLPLSGDVKDISPVTSWFTEWFTDWFSPQYEFNIAGNAALEKQVVTQVASYGKQLGKLTNAVLELADGGHGEAIDALRALAKDIDELKSKSLTDSIEADLIRLKAMDNAAYRALLKRLGD